jgi:reverse gyrase
MIPAEFLHLCPNCGGEISSERLSEGLLCKRCVEERVERGDICRYIELKGISGDFERVCEFREELKEFEECFEKTLGEKPTSIQKNWASKYFSGRSFALLAPTGVGKTTFGLILAKYNEERGKKSYLIFPTQQLVNQSAERLLSFGVSEESLLAYNFRGNASTAQKREELKKRISQGDFRILLTTTMFLYKNLEVIRGNDFKLIFIDDVDSIIKSSKRIDDVLVLLGFDEGIIEKAYELLRLRELRVRASEREQQSIAERIEEYEREIEEKKKRIKSRLIVSTATSRPKSKRVKLFRELLDFQVGQPVLNLRNVSDIYEISSEDKRKLWERSASLIPSLGSGGLIFLSSNSTIEELEEYVKFLNEYGVRAFPYYELDERIEEFKRGDAYPVGFASYRNPLARGVDLPQYVRYALFVGVPKMEFRVDVEEISPEIYLLLMILIPVLQKKGLLPEKELLKLQNDFEFLQRNLNRIHMLKEKERLSPQEKKIFERLSEISGKVRSILFREDVRNEIIRSDEISLKWKGEELRIITADVTGYIQASGRTSRFYRGGLSKGLAYILVDDQKALNSLKKKMRYYFEDVEFRRIDEVNIEEILEKVDEDRRKMKEKAERADFIKTAIIVVESPNKARTIANFFGRPFQRKIGDLTAYETVMDDLLVNIVYTKGHLLDLNKLIEYFGVRRENNLFIPIYEPIDEGRKGILEALRDISLEALTVYLATDPDTEGEKISFDVYLSLRPFNERLKRMEFHEVTKRAIRKALKSPRDISENLVKAQIVRRIADRWIGFIISQYLQRKLNNRNLSAGRVQTPVLEWIVRRTLECREKISIARIFFNGGFEDFEVDRRVELKKAKKIVFEELSKREESFIVAPLSTSQMIREASIHFGFSPQRTMEYAQNLFEKGLITYHRTDSIRVSEAGMNVAKEFIVENFGEKFFSPRSFSKEGAHECIRPTRNITPEELRILNVKNELGLKKEEILLYSLIFRIFMASQMKEARVEIRDFRVGVVDERGEVILEKRASYLTKILEEGCNRIIELKVQRIPESSEISDVKVFRRSKVKPYTYAEIIEEMREKGIGRPSTYAVVMEKLLERGYVVERNNYLFATKLAFRVLEVIKRNEKLYSFVREEYTRELEKQMDLIEEGILDYQEVLRELYEKLKEYFEELKGLKAEE